MLGGLLKNLASDLGCHRQAKLGGVYHAQTKFERGAQRQHLTTSTPPLAPLIILNMVGAAFFFKLRNPGVEIALAQHRPGQVAKRIGA